MSLAPRNVLGWVVAIAVLLALAFLNPPAWLPRSHAEAAIAFTSDRRGCCSIYVAGRDGSRPRPIADIKGHSPAWSPDGRRVAFVSWTVGTDLGDRDQEIWVMDADGGSPQQLTDNRVADEDPTWSADGRSIAFVRGAGGGTEIYAMQADGSHERRLTAAGFNVDPAWAPRGRRLAFIQWLHGWSSIYLIEADRGVQAHRIARIPSTVESLTWSPDGRWIAFGQGKSINRVRSDGGQPEQLVRRTEWIGQPAWSPTGSEIAFVSVLNGGFVWPDRYEIHALDLRTRTIREITKGEGDREPAWRP